MIKADFFGNILHSSPELLLSREPCDKTNHLQKIDYLTRNELTMGQIIRSTVKNSATLFSTIQEDSDTVLEQTSAGLFVESEYNEDSTDQYILLTTAESSRLIPFQFQVERAGRFLKLFRQMLHAVTKLTSAGMCHLDIVKDNIMMHAADRTIRISGFKKAIMVSKMNPDDVVKHFKSWNIDSIHQLEHLPIEVCILVYYANRDQQSDTLTMYEADGIREMLRTRLNQKWLDHLFNKEKIRGGSMTWSHIIDQLVETWKTWDLYSVCFLYLQYYKNIQEILAEDVLIEELLSENILSIERCAFSKIHHLINTYVKSSPSERLSIKGLYSIVNQI